MDVIVERCTALDLHKKTARRAPLAEVLGKAPEKGGRGGHEALRVPLRAASHHPALEPPSPPALDRDAPTQEVDVAHPQARAVAPPEPEDGGQIDHGRVVRPERLGQVVQLGGVTMRWVTCPSPGSLILRTATDRSGRCRWPG